MERLLRYIGLVKIKIRLNRVNSVIVTENLLGDSDSVQSQFKEALQLINLANHFQRANAIFINPNLTYPSYKKGVTTRLEYVKMLVASLREINSQTKIYIGEGRMWIQQLICTRYLFMS